MSLDTTAIGEVAAEFMESMEQRFGPEAEIGDVLIVAEVRREDGDFVHTRCSSDRYIVQRGLAESGCEALEGEDE